jgi:hypothetical protein
LLELEDCGARGKDSPVHGEGNGLFGGIDEVGVRGLQGGNDNRGGFGAESEELRS